MRAVRQRNSQDREDPGLASARTIELFLECGIDFALRPTHYVFGMHQGYEALFFDSTASDDPPVYQFVQGQGPPEIVWPSFTAYLRDVASQYYKH